MEALNLPAYDPRVRKGKGRFNEIWDPIRKKFVAMTPEEWVRQHILHFLTHYQGYPASLIRVEASLTYNRLRKRSDIVVYDKSGNALMLVECKAPDVPLTEDVFHQVVMYNRTFTGRFLLVSNGLRHITCRIDPADKRVDLLPDIPDYTFLLH